MHALPHLLESATSRPVNSIIPKYQLLPPLGDRAFQELKADIARRGVLVPIERDENGDLLDGHHRVRAWEELAAAGIHVEMPILLRLDLSESEKREHVRSVNLLRRHLTTAQRRAVIADQLRDSPERSDRAIAKRLAVSPSTVGMVRRRLRGSAATVQDGQSKRVGLDGRRRGAPKPRSVFVGSATEAKQVFSALEVLPPGVLPERILTGGDATVAARLVKQEASRESQMARMRTPQDLRELGPQRYSVVYIDPPWRYGTASDPSRTAEVHYPTMAHEELLVLPVSSIAADDAVVFLWATPPKLGEALALIAAWGFNYKTCACWDKGGAKGARIGLGSFYRQQHELLLVATRGKMPPPAPGARPPSIIRAARGAHSAKPPLAREQIEAMYGDVPRIELFARGAVPGWQAWGLEAAHSE